ncbi:hypothetical protein HWV62_10178 [Athelia sp. TMB]|nr:hypothetical protein HWV62_10178 [Athelia sp. TMB]
MHLLADIRIVGELDRTSVNPKADHFVVLKIDGIEIFESRKVPCKPAPQWKEHKTFQFATSSVIDIVVYRQSRYRKWVKHAIAECSGRGMDFLNTTTEQELVDKSGKPRIAVKLDLVVQSHSDFMKTVDEEVSQLTGMKGSDAIQIATTIGAKIGTALEAIVPVLDKFAGVGLSDFSNRVLTKWLETDTPNIKWGLDRALFCL